MRRFIAVLLTLCVLTPSTAFAGGVNRRDGFLMIWQAIARPALETREPPYTDVPEGSPGYAEITFAKARGILSDEEDAFRPDEELTLREAIIWLLKTRNVGDSASITVEELSVLLERYPFVPIGRSLDDPLVSNEDLVGIMSAFDTFLRQEIHEVSLYSEKFHGKGTASGEPFDMYAMTAAHKYLPFNTLVRVTNPESGKSVVVRITDRGPYVDGRDMDLSLAAFLEIAPRTQGIANVTFERLGDASLVDGCTGRERVYQKRITRTVRFDRGVPWTWPVGDELTLTANKAFVIRGIAYPDGTRETLQEWVLRGEQFSFTPGQEGEYVFTVGSAKGKLRQFRMRAWSCGSSGANTM